MFLSKEFQKFLVIGGLSTAINYGVFYGLFHFNFTSYIVAAISGYIIGLLFGYLFNRAWTFSSTNNKKVEEFTKYIGVYMASLVLSMFFLTLLVEQIGLSPLIANIFAIGLSTITNFLGCKLLVFSEENIGSVTNSF